ncbi:LlaMI restriction endonuclease [Bacillus cereus]|nr:LlaMI restriction endonuclease [Bacillus cereus]
MEKNKEKLIEIFRSNVKGKIPDISGKNIRHDGRRGHWLEEQFGITANGGNLPDILGYELKNETTSGKTTFGDWSANEYIFKVGVYAPLFSGSTTPEKQDSFCRIFGKPNVEKGGRFSWSGSPVPKIGQYNTFGQIMIIEDNLDIVIYYSYSQDRRIDKSSIIPVQLQHDNIVIARWYGISSPTGKGKTLKDKLEDKFDDLGWFTCKTDAFGVYQKICFGEPMTFDNWIKLVSEGTVYFDSGMYEGNKRPYSQWRANNTYWNSLITDCYE